MIDKNLVRNIVEEWLDGKDYFLVDVNVSRMTKSLLKLTMPRVCGSKTACS